VLGREKQISPLKIEIACPTSHSGGLYHSPAPPKAGFLASAMTTSWDAPEKFYFSLSFFILFLLPLRKI
jgi:hypothetical protein